MFELYIPFFLASFGSVDCSKGKPLGTVLYSFNGKFTGTNCVTVGLVILSFVQDIVGKPIYQLM